MDVTNSLKLHSKLSKLALAVLLAAPVLNAHAQRGPRAGGRHMGPPPIMTERETVSQHIGQYLESRQNLDVVGTLNIRRDLMMGSDLKTVTLLAQNLGGPVVRPMPGRRGPRPFGGVHPSLVELVVNNRVVAAQTLRGSSMEVLAFQIPNRLDARTAYIQVQGRIYAQTLSAVLLSPRDPVETYAAYLGLRTLGLHRVSVLAEVKRANPGLELRGMDLEAVVLNASSARGRATAQLVINGQAVGAAQFIPVRDARLRLALPARLGDEIGYEIRSIQLEIRGNVELDLVALEVTNNDYQQPGPVIVRPAPQPGPVIVTPRPTRPGPGSQPAPTRPRRGGARR